MPRDVDSILNGIVTEIKESQQFEKKASDFSEELKAAKIEGSDSEIAGSLLKFAHLMEDDQSVTTEDIREYVRQFLV